MIHHHLHTNVLAYFLSNYFCYKIDQLQQQFHQIKFANYFLNCLYCFGLVGYLILLQLLLLRHPFASYFLILFVLILNYQRGITRQFHDPLAGYLGLFGTHHEDIARALLSLDHLNFLYQSVHLHLLLLPHLFNLLVSFIVIFHSFQLPIFQHHQNIPRLQYFDHHAIFALPPLACQQVPALLKNFLGFIILAFICIVEGSLLNLIHFLGQL